MAKTAYEYLNLTEIPCQPYIEQYVAASAMLNTNLVDISYHPEEKWLKVWFDPELDASDKTMLDGIVADSKGKTKIIKRREVIMSEILVSATSQEQLGRLLDAIDSYTSMAIALDNLNYALARSRVEKVYTDGAITEADRDLVLLTIPTAEYE